MTVARSKRKRGETDPSGPSPVSRRRVRDSSSLGAEPSSSNEKNEPDVLPVDGVRSEESSKQRTSPEIVSETNQLSPLAKESGDGNDQENDSGTTDVKAPLHAEASNNTSDQQVERIDASEALLEPSSGAGGSSSREARIRAMLAHRKLILDRLRQGRQAAGKRLETIRKEEPQSLEMSVGTEVVKFRDLAKEATSLARKQARSDAEGGPAEKRTSVSLRRGPSVGKRMNTVLSSLAPGSSMGVPDVEASVQPLVQGPPTMRATTPAIAVTASLPKSTLVPSRQPPAIQPATLQKRDPSQIQRPASVPVRPSGPKSMKSQTATIMSRGPGTSIGNNSLNMPAGLRGPSHPPPARIRQPSVVCPEAVALRERRNVLRSKLTALIGSRQNPVSSVQLPPGMSAAGWRRPREPKPVNLDGPKRATALPPRRKTHWDTVLEEMRWAATDFMEERKWKLSAARVVGAAVLDRGEQKAQVVDRPRKVDKPKANGSTTEKVPVPPTEPSKPVAAAASEGGGAKKFEAVSADDEKLAREMAVTLSGMVSQASQIALQPPDSKHVDKVDTPSKDSATTTNTEGQAAEPMDGVEVENPPLDAATDEKLRKAVDDEVQRFSDVIDGTLGRLRKSHSKSKIAQASVKTHGLVLSTSQARVVESVEDCWERGQAGAVLCGPVASGKTVIAASLLWRERSSGPQLVVCSPASMIRWMHELGRFPDLERRVIDSTWDGTAFEPCDIVLCELSLVSTMNVSSLGSFRSIVVDCRFPSGFVGSRLPSCSEEKPVTPSELTSNSFWHLMMQVAKETPNRLLIRRLGPGETEQDFQGLSKRQTLDLLALRAAYLFGLSLDTTEAKKMAKTVISWARRRVKGATQNRPKYEPVYTLLLTIVDDLFFRVQGSKLLDDSMLSRSGGTTWEIQKCGMHSTQRSAYDNACREVRSSLSRQLSGTHAEYDGKDAFAGVSEALLRLRRQCFHADIDTVLETALIGARVGKALMPSLSGSKCSSPSEPNIDLARVILDGSSKLRELLSILTSDCDVSIIGADSLKPLINREQRKSSSKTKANKRVSDRTRKIAILAVLPEIQVLVSALLNSVGVDHELLLRGSRSLHATDSAKALLWTEAQLALSRFNDGGQRSDDGRSVNIVVTSPCAVAGDHCGLGIELADCVFCVDDDWSGRQEFVMQAAISRCLARRETSKDDGLRLVRLVASNTCEDRFLSGNKKSAAKRRSSARKTSEVEKWPYPLTCFGTVRAPDPALVSEGIEDWPSRPSGRDTFAFPGCNMFELRDKDLSEVLGTDDPLPPLFATAAELRFLPFEDDSDDVKVEIGVVSKLISQESREIQCQYGLSHFHSAVPPIAFPKNFATQLDLTIAASKYFVMGTQEGLELKTTDTLGPGLIPPSTWGSHVTAASASDVVTGWHDDTSPVESTKNSAASFLFYPSSSSGDTLSPSVGRLNHFAASFSSTQSYADGNQGAEALIYFPPLFPRLIESTSLATRDLASLRTRRPEATNLPLRLEDDSNTLKRAGAPRLDSDSKRPRLSSDKTASAEDDSFGNEERRLVNYSIVTEDEALYGDAGSILLDVSEDFGLLGIGALPMPRDSALAAGFSSSSTSNAFNPLRLFNTNEWAPSPSPADAEEEEDRDLSSADSVILVVSRKRSRGFAGLPAAVSQVHRPHTSISGSQWAGAQASFPIGSNGVFHDMNGANAVKKLKKKFPPKDGVPGVIASRPPLVDPAVAARAAAQGASGMPFAKAKDLHRSRLLATLRQSGLGATMFESPMFRVAAVCVRNRIKDRLLRHGWSSSTSSDAGQGLPLLPSQQSQPPGYRAIPQSESNLWTSVVRRLPNKETSTGTEAAEQSIAQRTTLRRSLNAPCRVDFGPFQSGFLSSPSGTTSLAPLRSRIGVSLPMGVKILQPVRDQNHGQWTTEEGERLQATLLRFGLNWILASRVLTSFQDIVTVSQRDSPHRGVPRAARSCRDRWQNLARHDPSMGRDIRDVERKNRDAADIDLAILSADKDPGKRIPEPSRAATTADLRVKPGVLTFLLPASRVSSRVSADVRGDNGALDASSTQNNETAEPPTPTVLPVAPVQSKPRRTFGAFNAAKAKKQDAPVTIPGVSNGSQPTVVQPHPSHAQSVQSSVAASWTSGRPTDMWPLHLLEAADRQRASAAAAAAPPALPVPPRQSSTSSSRPHVKPLSSSVPTAVGRPSSANAPSAPQGNRAPSFKPSSQSLGAPARGSPPRRAPAAAASSVSAMQSFAPPKTGDSAAGSSQPKKT